jgi:hypothetical protein
LSAAGWARRLVALLCVSTPLGARTRECKHVGLTDVPPRVWRTLVSQASGQEIEDLCSGTRNGQSMYSARVHGSGITVEVAPDGSVLHRQWSVEPPGHAK